MTLEPTDYVAILRAGKDLERAQIMAAVTQQQLAEADRRLHALMQAKGLDPTKPHRYDDLAFTLTPMDPASPAEG